MKARVESIGGTIVDLTGDAWFVLFNAFEGGRRATREEILTHTHCALKAIFAAHALAMQANMPALKLGVGIHQGDCALQFLGGKQRGNLTLSGPDAVLAARLEAQTTYHGATVLASAKFVGFPDFWRTPEHVNFTVQR